MTCPHCGADVPSGSSFCYACRKRVTGAAVADPSGPPPALPPNAALDAATLARPGVVVAIALLDFLGAAAALLTGGLLLFAAANSAEGRVPMAAFGLLALLFAGLQAACGLGLLWLKPWARVLQIVMAVLSICNVISILVLIYLLRPGVKLLFSGRPPQQMSALELELVKRQATLEGSGAVVIAVVLVLMMLVVPAVVGIIAAIAIPSLLRAKVSANESGTIGNLRTLVSAQAAYSGANGGSYEGQPRCLAIPAQCLPGYSGPAFVDEPMAAERFTRFGYVVRFFPGPAAVTDSARQSPTSVASYAWTAEPINHGRTGFRSFCADQTGVICSTTERQPFESQDGSGCPVGPSCEPLR